MSQTKKKRIETRIKKEEEKKTKKHKNIQVSDLDCQETFVRRHHHLH
jgi:hypothetical protein